MEVERGIGKKTICERTNTVASQLIHSNELTKLLQLQNYCGILLIDGKYLSVKQPNEKKNLPFSTKGQLVCIPFIDYFTHDIPVYIMAFSENSYELEQGFLKLKETGYPLQVLVCDEAMAEKLSIAAKKIFPDVIIQVCLTHYSRSIDRAFKVNSIKKKMQSLQKQLGCLGSSILIPTHYHDIEKARKISNELANLEYEYGYLIRVQSLFQNILWNTKTEEELNEAEDLLNIAISQMNLSKYPYHQRMKERYLDYYQKRKQLLSFLFYPELNIPKTTNLIEGFNSTTLEIRLSSIRGFEYEKTATNYINALILKRRFQKFTDCKGKFKHLNGKSPLEIAQPKNLFNFNFHSDDWIRFCKSFYLEPPK